MARKLAVLPALLGNQLVQHAGVEVVDLHGALDGCECLGCDGAGGFGAAAQNLIHVRDVLLELMAPLPDGGEGIFQNLKEEVLAHYVPEPAGAVLCLHLVQRSE